MTADAKVGLLLGLVFIVIIAFLVNGLPNFLQSASAKDAAVNVAITTETGPDFVIDTALVEKACSLDRSIPLRKSPAPQEVIVIENQTDDTVLSSQIPTYRKPQPVRQAVQSEQVQQVIAQTTIKPKTHVVKSGENLAVIAQKYYGDEEGNRRAVIQKLYEANMDTLDSPSKICVGNKIKVPTLEQLFQSTRPQQVRASSSEDATDSLLSKFSNLFERSDRNEAATANIYIVQEGESLWAIAEEKLGDGKRYKEIAKLNKIKNVNTVVAGTVLKLPR